VHPEGRCHLEVLRRLATVESGGEPAGHALDEGADQRLHQLGRPRIRVDP
jgi:hypothetical protein